MPLLASTVVLGGAQWVHGDEVLAPLVDFATSHRDTERQLERALLSLPSAELLRVHHSMVASAPHIAGTPGDQRVIDNLAAAMRSFGIPVELQELWLYLPLPVRGEVAILQPEELALEVKERPLAEDADTANAALTIGWNAYSGSGEAVGGVVYANYARAEDFAELEQLGVEVGGRIVVARYGELFRGFKALNAARAGAAGLLLYLDPEDSGWGRGIPYPEGGWANPSSIERGSLATLPYPGDPLTPFVEASQSALRLDPATLDLPQIPVQPIPWRSAQEILGRMRGPAVARPWQGGLPLAYRTSGGEALRVRVVVEQEIRQRHTANVIGTISGSEHPEQLVILGSHHDAWGFGAGDPTAGTIVVLEVARAFGELVRRGFRPRRSVVFAHWAAEEAGIQGSTEWVEARREELSQGAVAYVNLDGAAMGLDLEASAAPSLERLLREVMSELPQPDGVESSTLDHWLERSGSPDWPPFRSLGGGSDHVGFYTHAGIPALALHGRGADGTAYHTNYETLHWYRQVIGDDYRSALLLSRLVALLLARLANADLLPLDPVRWGEEASGVLDELATRAAELGVAFDGEGLRRAADSYATEANEIRLALRRRLESAEIDRVQTAAVSWELSQLERLWLLPAGLPERPWYRHLWAAPNPADGYGSWTWPEVRYALERQDTEGVRRGLERIRGVFQRLSTRLEALERLTRSGGSSSGESKPRQSGGGN